MSTRELEMNGQALVWPAAPRPRQSGSRAVMSQRRERALVRAAQRGDQAAVEALFRAHWPACHRAAWLVTRDAAAAEDIAQEAFLAALGALDRFDRRRPLGPWLRTIVAHRAIDVLRARAVRREVDPVALATTAAPDDPPPLRPSDDVLAAVAALPDEQRAVVVLRHLLDLTPSEIAGVLDVPVGTVNSRMRRGLDRLRVALAVALAAIVVASLPAPREAVADWVRAAVRVVAPGVGGDAIVHGQRLPGGGRLLAASTGGAVVVGGGRPAQRLLGAVDEATWSAHGRFVAAARGSELIAVDLRGHRRWSIAQRAPVRHPRWDPRDGFRVAYLSGGALHVVNGDGTGDRALGPAGACAPSWHPRAAHQVAYADPSGHVVLLDVDRSLVRWRTRATMRVVALAWAADGTRLLAVGRDRVRLLDGASGAIVRHARAPARTRNLDAGFAPAGHRYALLRRDRAGGTRVMLSPGRSLLAVDGPLRGLAWSPDGRWLAVGAPAADAWLLLHPGEGARRTVMRHLGGVSRRYGAGSAPRLEGWAR